MFVEKLEFVFNIVLATNVIDATPNNGAVMIGCDGGSDACKLRIGQNKSASSIQLTIGNLPNFAFIIIILTSRILYYI